jgi:hypothetical protein
MTDISVNENVEPKRELKAGDRLWIWLDGDPSPFENHLADILAGFPKVESEQRDNGVFHVTAYSWRGDPDFTRHFLKTYVPRKIELPLTRMISFRKVEGKEEFSIPLPALSFSHCARAGSVQVHGQKYSFENETLMVLASRQMDHDCEGPSLAGSLDALGLISLLSGPVLHSSSLFSSYFCITRKKFLNGTFGIVTESSVDWTPMGLSGICGDLDARNDRTHAALWFSGRAFSSNDDASKIVSYVTALEILTKGNVKNYLGRLYRRDKELRRFALEKVSSLMEMRGEVVHQGHRIVFPDELERYTQAFIIDAIQKSNNAAPHEFAVERLRKMAKAEFTSAMA